MHDTNGGINQAMFHNLWCQTFSANQLTLWHLTFLWQSILLIKRSSRHLGMSFWPTF